ncbi:PREDICTED: agamous-like MADS-box protein AGL82 [Camelina sativa]|uniref:Agamous-like MADS-box protein AGL82 n=1 Tax=Camelina sativa TaxID=90675 RepID=A0ABM1R1F5_CAMSA|nr:PREDICTED: agamous-like MADS-box protein AGL82 [Camelina sativa]
MTKEKVNLQRITNDKTRITTYKKRKASLYKKATEFSTLCGVKTCLIVYGPTKATDEVISEPEIWPRDETKVRDIIRKYKDTVSNSCKKENHVETFVNDLGKAKEMETNKKVPKSEKYCNWDQKLDKCSREQLRAIFCAVDSKLHEAVARQEPSMFRVHHQAMDTQIPQSVMDQHYMQQYFSEQPQFQGFPNNYNNMCYSFIPPHDDQIQMDPNLTENWTNLGLNQGLMMSKGNDGTQLMQRQAQPYYNREPVVPRSAAYNVNPFAGYQVPFNIPWRLSGNQVEDWDLSGKNPI